MNKLLVIGLGLAALAYAGKVSPTTSSPGVVPPGAILPQSGIVSASVLPSNPTGAQFVKVSQISKATAQANLFAAQKKYKDLRVQYLDPFDKHISRLRELIRGRTASGLGSGPTTEAYRVQLADLRTQYQERYDTLLAPIQAEIDKWRAAWRKAR